jgi:hypothetical protein
MHDAYHQPARISTAAQAGHGAARLYFTARCATAMPLVKRR